MAWTSTAPWDNIHSMSIDLEKDSESLTFRCTPSDVRALQSLMAEHFPMSKNRSLILRAVFRLGVPLLAEDPDLLTKAPTPKPETLTAAYFAAKREEKEREGTRASAELTEQMREWHRSGKNPPDVDLKGPASPPAPKPGKPPKKG